MMVCGLWRSLVARRTGGAKVAGSNPVSPILIMRIGSVSIKPITLAHIFLAIAGKTRVLDFKSSYHYWSKVRMASHKKLIFIPAC